MKAKLLEFSLIAMVLVLMVLITACRFILYPLFLKDCKDAAYIKEMARRRKVGVKDIPAGYCW